MPYDETCGLTAAIELWCLLAAIALAALQSTWSSSLCRPAAWMTPNMPPVVAGVPHLSALCLAAVCRLGIPASGRRRPTTP